MAGTATSSPAVEQLGGGHAGRARGATTHTQPIIGLREGSG
jgi:hypothetical protein